MATSKLTDWKPVAPGRVPNSSAPGSKLRHIIESQQFTLPLLMDLSSARMGWSE